MSLLATASDYWKTKMFVSGLFLAGVASIWIEIWAVGALLQSRCTLRLRERWLSLLLGMFLAACSPFFGYSLSNQAYVCGIPFPAAAFERHNDGWIDFVGPTTLVFGALNAAVFLLGPLAATVLFHEWRKTKP